MYMKTSPIEILATDGGASPDLPRLAEKIFADHEAFRVVEEPAPAQEGQGFVRFYGLRENPFSDAVNPAFFYKTQSHAEALDKMLLAAEHNTSLGMITGPSGTGKTLVTQLLLQHLDPAKYQAILVLVSPGLGKTGLLREILSELGIAVPEGISRAHDMLRILGHFIMELHENGKRLVLIIDECHFLSAECLHIIRTISNIEIPECKLTTSLLFGEEKFTERLKHQSYESLRNRMYLRGELRPMDAEECAQYIKYRLMVAGRANGPFDDAALAALHKHSKGICRNLSKLCMLTLLMGGMKGKAVIGAEDVESCVTMM